MGRNSFSTVLIFSFFIDSIHSLISTTTSSVVFSPSHPSAPTTAVILFHEKPATYRLFLSLPSQTKTGWHCSSHGCHHPPVADPVMGDPPRPSAPPPPGTAALTLMQPSAKKKNKHAKVFRVFRNIFRSFPIITPTCRLPSLPGGRLPHSKVTGTLFGYRKGRVSLSIQENSRTLPSVVVELAMQTHVLQKEMNLGMVRIALECEKQVEKDRIELLEEPLWTMFCNGKKNGYGVKREPTEEDLHVMEVLKAVSMGAGVLPGRSDVEGPDGEMGYMRAHFDRVVGSKDSETLYMVSPDGNTGPELSIFFVRVG